MTCWAIVALNARAKCKTRLGEVLPPSERLVLVRAMLDHVLKTLTETPGIDRIALVSPEPGEAPRAALHIQDEGRGQSVAAQKGLSVAAHAGADRVVIFPADLPRLKVSDVLRLAEAMREGGCAIAPDRSGRGTNGLALSLPTSFRFQFGPESLARHVSEARARGLKARIVRTPGLAFDLDTPADLDELRHDDLGVSVRELAR